MSLATALLLEPANLLALNGLEYMGIGPRNRAMGGANGAAPVDSSTILVNPAGLTQLPTSCDLGAQFTKISTFVDTRHAKGIAINTKAGLQHAVQRYYISPFTGIVYNPACSKWAFGLLNTGLASGGAVYRKPIVKPALLLEPVTTFNVGQTGAIYDTSAAGFIFHTSFAAAYSYSDQLSLGAAMNVDTFFFSADSAVSTPVGLVQTKGRGRLDISYGLGFSLGALYQINSEYSVGATFVSPEWFEQSKLYADLLPKFRLPPTVRLGFAYRSPCMPLLLTMDIKWIGWHQVRPFKISPANGGFGWRDQYTIGLGLQYNVSDALTARAGYNYGRATITSDKLFANALFPIWNVHHLSAGLEYQLTDRSFAAVALTYDFKKTFKENGKGDAVSKLGKGVKAGVQNTDITFAWSLRF
jgi:long-chain fatty acid transport protein